MLFLSPHTGGYRQGVIHPDLEPKLLRLVHTFEGGWAAGNADGQILSWGPLQWNIGQGTLEPLLLDLCRADEASFRTALGASLTAALLAGDLSAYVQRSVLEGDRVRPDYQARFAALAACPATPEVWAQHATPYLERAERDALKLGFETERGLALCFDIAVQNGGVRTRVERATGPLESHVDAYWKRLPGNVLPEWKRLKALAQAVADSSTPRWRSDVLARKLTVAVGQGSVHGRDFDLERDFGIRYYLSGKELAPWRG